MAPTELLAEQHLANLRAWLAPLGVEVAWLAGKVTGKARKAALADVASGRAQMVVGTHALMQEGVVFADLALAIVDEQHRFGVHQRLALRDKGAGGAGVPHQLVMTATPIPRTLAMAAYADLDVSAIDEQPPGRTPVQTVALGAGRRPELVERIRAACALTSSESSISVHTQ
jgi:ATP-dependent DNA helicase RecG